VLVTTTALVVLYPFVTTRTAADLGAIHPDKEPAIAVRQPDATALFAPQNNQLMPICPKTPSVNSRAYMHECSARRIFRELARIAQMAAIKPWPKFAATKPWGRSCLPPHDRNRRTYLPMQVATVAGVQTSRPV
jgi:hypothetical protein